MPSAYLMKINQWLNFIIVIPQGGSRRQCWHVTSMAVAILPPLTTLLCVTGPSPLRGAGTHHSIPHIPGKKTDADRSQEKCSSWEIEPGLGPRPSDITATSAFVATVQTTWNVIPRTPPHRGTEDISASCCVLGYGLLVSPQTAIKSKQF